MIFFKNKHKFNIFYFLQNYINLIKCRNKYSKNKKIKIGFFVIYNSVFPYKCLIDYILECEKNHFIPKIIVIPDVARGKLNMIKSLKKTYNYCKAQYPNIEVINTFDEEKNKFLDIKDLVDIVFFSTPYDDMVYKYYKVNYLNKQSILSCFVPYGFLSCDNFSYKHILKQRSVRRSWINFIDSTNLFNYLKSSKYVFHNLILSGYCKMDSLQKYTKKTKSNKVIILAPHHTIGNFYDYPLSTFLKFSDTYIKIIKKYQNINFVFRPHPLLKITLESDNYWGKEKTNNYFETIINFTNVDYQDGGDYLQTFVDSDGIITDCGSFLAEYLYTDNPGCYILKNNETTDLIFNDFGKKCLDHYYLSYNENDIFDYIDNIILKNNDYKKEKRILFSNEEIKINFPNVSSIMIDCIEQKLKIREYK